MGQGSKKKLQGKGSQLEGKSGSTTGSKKHAQGNPEKGRPLAKKAEPRSDSGEKPVLAKSVLEKKEIKKLIQKGKERGAISFDELNEGLGPEINSLEENRKCDRRASRSRYRSH